MPEGYTHAYIAKTAAAQSAFTVKNKAAFIAGAQGGDLFFSFESWKPSKKRRYAMKELGNRLHEENTQNFLKNLAKHAQTQAQLDYFMGFLAHYTADTTVHPYVVAVTQKGQVYDVKCGHGYFEIALDTHVWRRQTGRSDFGINKFAPKLIGAPLAQVVGQLNKALLDTYGVDVPWQFITDAIAHNRAVRSMFSSRFKFKYTLFWLIEPLFGGRGTITVHVHPRNLRGSSKHDIKKGKILPNPWQDPTTGETHAENIDELIERAVNRTAEVFSALLKDGMNNEFWELVGSCDYVTGMQTELSAPPKQENEYKES